MGKWQIDGKGDTGMHAQVYVGVHFMQRTLRTVLQSGATVLPRRKAILFIMPF